MSRTLTSILAMAIGLALPAWSDWMSVQAGTEPASGCASTARPTATAGQTASSDFDAEKKRYLDQYASQIDCWTSAMTDGVLPSDTKKTDDPKTEPGKDSAAWLSVAWQEVKGEWEKLQLATKENWDPSKHSFEKAWTEFSKARSDAGEH